MYMFVKHLHLTAVAVSISLFILRFVWSLRGSAMMQKKWVRVVPHAVDTILLASAVTLCILIAQYPLVHGWLTQKVIAVIAYVLVGLWTLKRARSTKAKWLGFAGALLCLAVIAKLALFKQPLLAVLW